MYKDKQSFNQFFLLASARVCGILFSIAIPMYLGRMLPIETYGTYKQLMLFFWFSQVALNLGVDDSVYNFLKWNPEKFPLYSFNAMVFNIMTSGILWFFLVAYKNEIAHLVRNPNLAQYLPVLGYLILTTICSMQIEGMLIVGLNRFNERLIVDIGTELLKSFAVIGAFFFFNSIYIALVFLSLIMTIRLLTTILIIHSVKKSSGLSYGDAPQYFMSQVSYGVPLGASRIMQNILNMDNFFISRFFNLTQFTFYSVGCFENPIVNATRSSMFELVNIEMVDAVKDGDFHKATQAWRSMTRKLFLVVVPFATYMVFFSKELIVFIFSKKYLSSVPFFMIFNIFFFVGALNPEPFFRSTSNTTLALKIKIFGLLIGLFLLVGGAFIGGPIYALSGKILGVFIMNVIGLFFGAKLLGTTIDKLFQWKDLFLVFLVSTFLAAITRIIFWNMSLNVFFILALSFTFYVTVHFILSCYLKIIRDDEIFYLKSKIQRLIIKR